ncbi:hypothetical protein TB2_016636 [Malus domestica]
MPIEKKYVIDIHLILHFKFLQVLPYKLIQLLSIFTLDNLIPVHPLSPSLSAHLLPSLKSPIPSPILIEASSINKKWSVSRIKMGKLSYIKYHNPTAVVIVASMVMKTRVDTVGFSPQVVSC